MRILKQALSIAGALFVVVVAFAVIAPRRAQAVAAALVQIVPGSATHVGQYESKLVSLNCVYGVSFCQQVNPNGTTTTTEYTVPAGYTLVITDLEWVIYGGSGEAGYNACYFFIAEGTGAYINDACAIADKNGTAAGKEHFTGGVPIASGVVLVDPNAGNSQGSSNLQGYLVPNN
jgi:hypothetical protein